MQVQLQSFFLQYKYKYTRQPSSASTSHTFLSSLYEYVLFNDTLSPSVTLVPNFRSYRSLTEDAQFAHSQSQRDETKTEHNEEDFEAPQIPPSPWRFPGLSKQ